MPPPWPMLLPDTNPFSPGMPCLSPCSSLLLRSGRHCALCWAVSRPTRFRSPISYSVNDGGPRESRRRCFSQRRLPPVQPVFRMKNPAPGLPRRINESRVSSNGFQLLFMDNAQSACGLTLGRVPYSRF